MSSASSQTEHQVDGAVLFDVVIRQSTSRHVLTLVDEPLLGHGDPLSLLHLCLEVAHSLIRFDVVSAHVALVVSEENLEGLCLDYQQRHLGARLQTAPAEHL